MTHDDYQDYEPEPPTEPPEPECCEYCGKELEDFSDLGCERCDSRHPGYGTIRET